MRKRYLITPMIFPICFIAVAVALIWLACDRQVLPADLVGTWVTDDQRFEDRTMTITPTNLVFGVPGEPVAVYAINKTSLDVEKHIQKITIYYESIEQSDFILSLRYNPSTGDLRFKNRPDVIWRQIHK